MGLFLRGCRSSPRAARFLLVRAFPLLLTTLVSLGLACAEKAPRANPAGDATVEALWATLLDTMEYGPPGALTALQAPTCPGFLPLSDVLQPIDGVQSRSASLVRFWRSRTPLWPSQVESEVHVALGPVQPAMTTVCLRRLDGHWRLAGVLPGE